MEFRLLRADEIDARVATVKEDGLSILLYKDARCDMNILDETVGAFNWQRSHSRDNANCIVSIWDESKSQWVAKEDTGTESYTEKEKGLASDSFKRACFNWGIGRELYTAPFIWFPAKDCRIKANNGRFSCYDCFMVEEIEYTGRKITYVRVKNASTGKAAEFGRHSVGSKTIGETRAAALVKMIVGSGGVPEKIAEYYGVGSLAELTESQHANVVRQVQKREPK